MESSFHEKGVLSQIYYAIKDMKIYRITTPARCAFLLTCILDCIIMVILNVHFATTIPLSAPFAKQSLPAVQFVFACFLNGKEMTPCHRFSSTDLYLRLPSGLLSIQSIVEQIGLQVRQQNRMITLGQQNLGIENAQDIQSEEFQQKTLYRKSKSSGNL